MIAAAPAGKVLAFPAPRAQGRRALVLQLAAAAACLLLVVALAHAPDRQQERSAARAPAPAADAAPEAAAASRPTPTAVRALGKSAQGPADRPGVEPRRDEADAEAPALDAAGQDPWDFADRTSTQEDRERLVRRKQELAARELEGAARAREEGRDAAGERASADAADQDPAPAPPAQGARPATPETRPPSAPSGNDAGGVAPGGRGGSSEPLGEPDRSLELGGDTQAGRTRGAPTAPSAPAPPSAPAETAQEEPTRASDALGAWRTTLAGEPLDVALVAGAAGSPPRLVVARRKTAAFTDGALRDGANTRGVARTDEVQLLGGASSSPELARALEAQGADEEDAKLDLDDADKALIDAGTRTRLLLALLAHEVGQDSPTASAPEAVVIARAERVAALLAALDGRPLDGALPGDRAGRQSILRQARERVERDVPAPARSAR